jgi:hypothetical protein
VYLVGKCRLIQKVSSLQRRRHPVKVPAKSMLAVSVAVGATWVGSATALPAFTTAPKVVVAPRGTPQAVLTQVAVGRHATFDRIVFRWRGSTPGYNVEYVPRLLDDGSGAPYPILGRRFLAISFFPHVNAATPGVPNAVTPRFPTLRQVKVRGTFEAVLTAGVGLSRRAGFRVFTLTNPRRTVIDVAH